MRWVKRLFGLRLYNKDDVAALIQRNVRLREHNRRVIELEWKASFSEMQMEGLERESKRRREAESERFKSDKALKAAARVFAERETDLLHRISALESIVDRLPKTSRWVVSSETTPSGKTLFKCGSCFRLSVGPDKKCPSGCDAWDGMPKVPPVPYSGAGFTEPRLNETLEALSVHSVCAICGETVHPHAYVHIMKDARYRFASIHEDHDKDDGTDCGWWPVDETCSRLFPDAYLCVTLPMAQRAPQAPFELRSDKEEGK